MPDDDVIPADLIEAQRRYDAAQAAVTHASARDSTVGLAELDALRTTARQAAVALHRARTAAGQEWAAYTGQRRIQDTARAE